MADEGFGVGAAAFEAAEAFHGDVPFVQQGIHALAFMAAAGSMFLFDDRADVHPVGGMEQLALGAGHGLEIVQVEAAVQAAPGIQDQQGADAVVAVAVNGPVGNHHVRFFLLQQFPHLAVAFAVQLRIAIHLVHEQEPGTGDGAGSLHFLYADGGRFVVRFACDAGLAPGQVNAYHLVARRGKQAHGAAGAGFRVVRMSPDNQDFLFAFHRLISG